MNSSRYWITSLLAGTLVCAICVTARPKPDRDSGTPAKTTRASNRAHWPAALRGVSLGRLSSGALLRLDVEGDLVELPGARVARAQALLSSEEGEAPAVTLDPRVGANIRLGDDPPALPASTRAQAEPHIVRSPINSNYLIATFQEGRYADGSAVNCGYSVSRDGGFSWTRALIPNLTPSSGGPYPRATDPVAGVAPSGNAYLNTLSAGSETRGGTVLVSRSTNGDTFGPPRVAYQASTPDDFPDKNWMAINTFPSTPSAGRIVVTFTLFPAVGNGPHPIMRVYSDTAGESWSSAAFVHSDGLQVQGSQPVFLPDGKLAIVYWNFNGTDSPADDFLELVVSQNGGVTFGVPKFITAVNFYDTPSIRDGGFLPSATTDRTTGSLYVTYQALHNGSPRIMFTKSTNAGTTWTPPVPVSDNPNGIGVFNAAITASPDGQRLAIAFYDKRNNPSSSTRVDLYVAHSFNGGASWQPNLLVTSVSSDAALAPLTPGGYMLGDYQGIAEPISSTIPAVPVWVDTRTGNPDPFTARVQIVPPPAEDRADFNGDGQVDLIWQNRNTGDRAIWLMNGTTRVGASSLPRVSTQWQIAGLGDFNGNGQVDIVWENTVTGQRTIWLMNGTSMVGVGTLPTVETQWRIAGTGDFNGNGQVDLVWQNNRTGERVVWLMNGTTRVSAVFLPTTAIQWQIAAVNDFNWDGQVDLLWQNTTTGERAVWLMNATARVGVRSLPTVATQWQIAGAGEFNGDGQVDILWQNTSNGQRTIWLMNETNLVGARSLPTTPTSWEIRNH